MGNGLRIDLFWRKGGPRFRDIRRCLLGIPGLKFGVLVCGWFIRKLVTHFLNSHRWFSWGKDRPNPPRRPTLLQTPSCGAQGGIRGPILTLGRILAVTFRPERWPGYRARVIASGYRPWHPNHLTHHPVQEKRPNLPP